MSKLKPGKVAIIGCGFVGSASAFALMQSGLFTEMVLLDANPVSYTHLTLPTNSLV